MAPFVPLLKSRTWTEPQPHQSHFDLFTEIIEESDAKPYTANELRQQGDSDRERLYRIIDAQNNVVEKFAKAVEHVLHAPNTPEWDAHIKRLSEEWVRKHKLGKFSEMT